MDHMTRGLSVVENSIIVEIPPTHMVVIQDTRCTGRMLNKTP